MRFLSFASPLPSRLALPRAARQRRRDLDARLRVQGEARLQRAPLARRTSRGLRRGHARPWRARRANGSRRSGWRTRTADAPPSSRAATSPRPRPPGRRTASGSPSSPRAARTRTARTQAEPLAHPARRRRGGGPHRREGRRRPRRAGRRTAAASRSSSPTRARDDEEKADKEKRDARVVGEDVKRIRLAVIPAEKDAEGKRSAAAPHLRRPERRQRRGSGQFRLVARTASGSRSTISRPRTWTTGRRETSRWSRSSRGRCGRWPRPRARSPIRRSRRTAARSHTRWRRRRCGGRARRASTSCPLAGGAPRALAATFDERPDLLGWTADGTRVVVGETRGTVEPADRAARGRRRGHGHHARGHDGRDGERSMPRAPRSGFVSQAPDRAPEAFVGDLPVAAAPAAKGKTRAARGAPRLGSGAGQPRAGPARRRPRAARKS